jgi:hypothetical protein
MKRLLGFRFDAPTLRLISGGSSARETLFKSASKCALSVMSVRPAGSSTRTTDSSTQSNHARPADKSLMIGL